MVLSKDSRVITQFLNLASNPTDDSGVILRRDSRFIGEDLTLTIS